mmetsp:Transcript_6140/g.17589  ORF Transcript_6140/g.17589 Transcript_6140/m.17589 type:complete len:261 (+) Transcript_6140:1465-2247(+)
MQHVAADQINEEVPSCLVGQIDSPKSEGRVHRVLHIRQPRLVHHQHTRTSRLGKQVPPALHSRIVPHPCRQIGVAVGPHPHLLVHEALQHALPTGVVVPVDVPRPPQSDAEVSLADARPVLQPQADKRHAPLQQEVGHLLCSLGAAPVAHDHAGRDPGGQYPLAACEVRGRVHQRGQSGRMRIAIVAEGRVGECEELQRQERARTPVCRRTLESLLKSLRYLYCRLIRLGEVQHTISRRVEKESIGRRGEEKGRGRVGGE